MFLGLVSLDVIAIGPFSDMIREGIVHTVGRWSLMSFIKTLLEYLPHKFWLTIILSIRVADECVILVGLIIVGTSPKSRLLWINSLVSVCSADFKKSILWSSPIMIVLGLYPFSFGRGSNCNNPKMFWHSHLVVYTSN